MTTLTARLTGDQVVPPVSTTSTGTATVTVNSGKSGMTYTVTANLDDSAPAVASLLLGAPGKDGQLVRELPISNTTTVGSLSLECTNKWLRHLALYVQYLDADGHVLPAPNWDEQIPDFLRSIYEPNPDKHYLDMIPPVTTVFGIPVKPDPIRITVRCGIRLAPCDSCGAGWAAAATTRARARWASSRPAWPNWRCRCSCWSRAPPR